MTESRVVLVTGATSGIGAATAKAFGVAGERVVLAGRRADKGEAIAKEIKDAGGEATFIQTDVADPEQVQHLVDRTLETYGRLDAAFNNAGIEGDAFVPAHEQTLENYDRVFDVNVKSILTSTKAEIAAMLKTGGGSIINNASVAGMSVYAASKHAVVGLTKNIAVEYAQMGIRANAVAPGPIDTEMFARVPNDEVKEQMNAMIPMGRAGTGAEIASAVLWLADPANSYTTGQVIAVDGGLSAG